MKSNEPHKRIPTSLGTDTKLFGNYTLADLAVAGFPGVVIALAVQMVVPPSAAVLGVPLQALTIPLAAVGTAVGGVFVALTPQYVTSIEWVESCIRYRTSPDRLRHEKATATTQVERVHPDVDVVERTDGAFVGMVEVSPATMALATDDEWARKAQQFEEFLNSTVEFPIQLYATTRDFDVEQYVDQFRGRLEDPDVVDNAQLTALIEDYVDWYVTDYKRRPSTIRDHYVVVPVTPAEVQFERDALARKLTALPVLGFLIRAVTAPPVVEERRAMLDELDDRLQRVENGLRDVEDIDARRLPTDDLCTVIGEYWTNNNLRDEDTAQRLRTSPLVTAGESR